MALPKLTVNLDGPTGRTGRVLLDGLDITDGLESLTIEMSANDITRSELRLFVGELEVDAQTLALLRANVKVTDPPTEPEFQTFGKEPAHA